MIRFFLSALLPMAVLATPSAPVPGTAIQDFNYNNATEPHSLDPALMQGTPEFRICMALFEGLVVPNAQTAKAEPGLAESWTISGDMKTYTFKLRKAVWSDGTPITAQDVVDSWMRTLDPSTDAMYASSLVGSIVGASAFNHGKGLRAEVGIRALDVQTFEVEFVEPMPYAIEMLTQPCYAVMPMHAIKKFGKNWAKPGNIVSNGPFVLQEWVPRQRITVTRNKNYWDAEHVKLDCITFFPDESAQEAYGKYKAGELDWLSWIDPRQYDEIKSRLDYHQMTGSTVYYYCLNVYKKPLNDVRVRKALSMALDRQELCEKILTGGNLASGGFVPPMGSFKTTPGTTFNPEKAKQLLVDAGFPEGKGFPKFKLIFNTSNNHKKIAEWVKVQWKTVLGIEIKIENVEWSRFLDLRTKHDFEISRAGWQADFADPMNFLNLFRSRAFWNDGQYSNARFDELLATSDRLPLGESRDKVLMQAEDLMISEDQAVIPLYFYTNQNLINLDKWGGWYENSMDIHPWKAIYKK